MLDIFRGFGPDEPVVLHYSFFNDVTGNVAKIAKVFDSVDDANRWVENVGYTVKVTKVRRVEVKKSYII